MAVNKVKFGSQTLIDLTSDTVTADKLAVGETAHDASGAVIVGTMSGGGGGGDEPVPVDGKTRIWLEIPNDGKSTYEFAFTIKYSQSSQANTYKIDWGDGSPIEQKSGSTIDLNHAFVANTKPIIVIECLTSYKYYLQFVDYKSIPYPVKLKLGVNCTFGVGSSSGNYRKNSLGYLPNVTDIDVTEQLTSFPSYFVQDCFSLKNINFSANGLNIGTYAFSRCYGLTKITIPNGCKSIGTYAFDKCVSLKKIDIPNSVTSIGNYAFFECSGIEDLLLHEGLTSIGNYAFNTCRSLTSVILPSTITTINVNAFNICSNLKTVYCLKTSPPTLQSNVFRYDSLTNIYVPAQSVNAYKTATNWSEFASKISAMPEE